ncbi:MAG: GTP cyclohydrolase I FolE [Phycisphaerales bacterium]|nr:GTP cyclohydrolase I FolE [Phycisphaerales bacterium]
MGHSTGLATARRASSCGCGDEDCEATAAESRLPVEVLAPGKRIDTGRIEKAVKEILIAIGEDPTRDGLLDTPKRVAKAYAEIFGGLHETPDAHLSKIFTQEGPSEVVICRDIQFSSMCEHHLLPFMGKAHVAYLPNGTDIVGLSKLARTVDVFARRPQVQEKLTNQVADALDEHLTPKGVLVVIESEHLCMKMRGAKKQGSTMVTVAARGVFTTLGPMRAEVMSLMTGRPA